MAKTALKNVATIKSKWEVTIPREVRRKLGIKKGDKVQFAEESGVYQVVPVRETSPFEKYRGIGNPGIRGGLKSVLRYTRKLRGR